MADFRRNACPSLAAPMRTGDGWLARLPPLASPLSPAQLAAIATTASLYGNGLVEISKRGNLQLRGLASPDATALAADLAAAGLVLGEGIPVSSDPLAEGAAPTTLITALHRHLAETGIAGRLAPKVAAVLDLGTPTAPTGVAADLRLAFRDGRVHLGLGGTHSSARWIGSVAADEAIAAAVAVLAMLAALGPEARLAGPHGHRDDERFSHAGGVVAGPPPVDVATAAPVGPMDLGHPAHAIAFPFGQTDAATLGALADAAALAGIAAIAPAPERALIVSGSGNAVAATVAAAGRLGFITEAADPRRFVAACIGSEGCASGRYPARAMARSAIDRLAPLLDGTVRLHFSGCGKGCAHPDPADFTLSGIDNGAGLVLDGRARDQAIGFDRPDGLVERMGRLADRLCSPGIPARKALDRIGPAGLARELFGEESAEHGGEPEPGAGRHSEGRRLPA